MMVMTKIQENRDWRSHPFSVERSTLFRMIRIINYVGQAYQQNTLTQSLSLSRREWRVLLVIASHPDVSATQVSEISGYSQMAISRAVRSLIGQNRLIQKTDPADRRRSCLNLTDDGWAVYRQLVPVVVGFEDNVLGALDAHEREILDIVLDRAVSRITSEPIRSDWQDEDDD
jgi:DNA-binding MarR family transcriptional regulator